MSARFTQAGDRQATLACPHCQSAIQQSAPIAICDSCGAPHHQGCWETHNGCGAYACAPARRQAVGEASLKINTDDLARARPLPPRITPVTAGMSAIPRTERAPTGINRTAIAAAVLAVAGIPLFGLVTGAIAVLLGSLALGSIHRNGQKGAVFASIGVALGLLDVIAWAVVLVLFFNRQGMVAPGLHDLKFDGDLANIDPIVGRALRANVFIQSPARFGGASIGSGIILEVNGNGALIVTNRHVVDTGFTASIAQGAQPSPASLPSPTVRFIDQTVAPGTVVWLAPGGVDLALVSVPSVGVQAKATAWRPGTPMKIGEPVFAIGNPAALGWTQTQGSISQFRQWEVAGRKLRVIQTHAAINPGNSGGGLYNQEGWLIGINTLTSDKHTAEGLSFAIAFEEMLSLDPPPLRHAAGQASSATAPAPGLSPSNESSDSINDPAPGHVP